MNNIERNKLLNHIKNIFEEIDSSNFNFDTKFKENEEWDSMCALNLMAILDDNYNVKINGNQIDEINTINELINFIDGS